MSSSFLKPFLFSKQSHDLAFPQKNLSLMSPTTKIISFPPSTICYSLTSTKKSNYDPRPLLGRKL